jgi:site-specific DNA-methyltransferase (adenine-specific)
VIENVWLYQGNCVEVLRQWPDNSVDAVVCDPPYEIGFMKKGWDSAGVAFDPATWAEALRVLKPGGHMLTFGGSRTFHRMACAIEDAGFQIRDSIMWLYGSGFPKSKNIALAIDKGEGHPNRGRAIPVASTHLPSGVYASEKLTGNPVEPYTAKSPEAAPWEGWGTALKPAHEPIILARKPLDGTIAENVQMWGTGALNIDGCRIGERWPANVMLDEEAAALLDKQANASRFFYVSKVSQKERDHGLDGFPVLSRAQMTDREEGQAGVNHPRAGAGSKEGSRNPHPTVKPVALMRQLVRLVTPPGGIVLDPFVGSGTTGMAARLEGFKFIGVDLSAEYLTIAYSRIAAALTLE